MIEPLESRQLLTAAPLLSAEVVKSTLPATFVAGSKVHGSLLLDVINLTGSIVSGSASLSVFATADGVVDASSIPLISNHLDRVKLKADKTQVVALPIKSLPASVGAGTYTLLAEVVDPAETPDIATTGPTITAATPVISLSVALGRVAPASIKDGKAGAVTMTITNSGNVASTGLMAIDLGISSDGSTEAAPFTTTYIAPNVAAGHRVSIRLHFKVPATQTGGTFVPYAAINQLGSVASGFGTVGFTILGPQQVPPAAVNFTDDYTTNIADYTAANEAGSGITGSWTVSNRFLNYSRIGNEGYYTSDLLLNANVASTAGLTSFTTSGDLLNIVSSGEQPGLIVSADNTNGGYVIMQEDAGAFAGHLLLLRETGPELLGDEGLYSGTSPLVADFGLATLGDSYNISATVSRTGNHPVFQVKITDLTTKAVSYNGTVTDTSVPASYGGDQVGWRVRADADSVTESFGDLSLTGS